MVINMRWLDLGDKVFGKWSPLRDWLFGLILISMIYSVLIWVVDPFGDFPFNDDWAYSMALESWQDGNGLHIPSYVSPLLLGQLLWSLPWIAIYGGFSFAVAASSVTAMVVCALAVLYCVLGRMDVPMYSVLFILLLIIMNPVFLLLGFTYMTDVPFAMICLMAFLSFMFWTENPQSMVRFLFFLLLVAWAFLIRQPGIFLAFLPLFHYLEVRDRVTRNNGLIALGFGVIMVVATHLILLESGISDGVELRTLGDTFKVSVVEQFFQFVRQLFGHAGYIGFFTIPLAAIFSAKLDRRMIFMLMTFSILLTAVLYTLGESFPYKPNIMRNGGVGPETLRDVYLLGMSNTPKWPNWFGFFLHFLTMMSIGVIIFQCKAIWRSPLRQVWARSAMLFIIGYWIICSMVSMFDRYMLPLIPILAILLMFFNTQRPRFLAWFFLIAMSLFSILASRECFSWHRSLAEAVQRVQRSGWVSSEVDFGYEWMGRLNYEKVTLDSIKYMDWWVVDPKIILAFGPVDDYDQIDAVPFYRCLWQRQDSIHILSRRVEWSDIRVVE